MAVECDPAKARANLRKHLVRFADAVTALEDASAISVRDERGNEERWITIGMDSLARRCGNMRKEYDFSKGRRGAVLRVPPEKTRVTIRLDDDILDWFRQQVDDAGGGNYQTLINEALCSFMHQKQESLETTLRRVIREEIRRAG